MIGQTNAILSLWLWSVVCLIAFLASDMAAAEREALNVPLVNENSGAGLAAAPGFGGKVSVREVDGIPTTNLSFHVLHSGRRLFALEGVPSGSIEGARALAFDCLFHGPQPEPTIVAVFFERDGGVWYRYVRSQPYVSGFRPVRLPLHGSFDRARFAADDDETIRWDQIDRVWLGVLSDYRDPDPEVLVVRRARFTDEPFHPESPIGIGGGLLWNIAQDPAVESSRKLDFSSIDYRFEIPGGRHMCAMVRTPVEVDELDAYSGLQFTYQAELPDGIDGLLVMLIERDGTQYRAVPVPAESSDWKTVTIPFEKFERGSWSKDENDKLDLDQVGLVAIGMHGTTPATAEGTIKVREVQIVP